MSKPISFGFGKPKLSGNNQSERGSLKSLPLASKSSKSHLRHDSDNEEEEEPKHESVTGFSSSGAILSQPLQEKVERVIKNSGNSDWRKRGLGTNLLPAEVQAQQNAQKNGDLVMVERDEISTTSGLQFAEGLSSEEPRLNGHDQHTRTEESNESIKPLTADEEALQALLEDGSGKPKSSAIISQQGNMQLSTRDELGDFRSDVASRPDSSSLEDYVAMPVEEFGLAMLRGMGQKRRANGELIELGTSDKEEGPKKVRRNEGFLGIGAKAAPGSDIELGAWGKADMRKNSRGQGFFIPLMRENKETGERLTEEDLQQKLKDAKGQKGDEDWRLRRDRYLVSNGRSRGRDSEGSQDRRSDRERYESKGSRDFREQMNDFTKDTLARREHDNSEEDNSRRKRERDRHEDETSRYRRRRSRSRDRRHRHDDYNDNRSRDKYHNRRREDSRDDDRYDSGSSRHRKAGDRDRDNDHKHRNRD